MIPLFKFVILMCTVLIVFQNKSSPKHATIGAAHTAGGPGRPWETTIGYCTIQPSVGCFLRCLWQVLEGENLERYIWLVMMVMFSCGLNALVSRKHFIGITKVHLEEYWSRTVCLVIRTVEYCEWIRYIMWNNGREAFNSHLFPVHLSSQWHCRSTSLTIGDTLNMNLLVVRMS